MWSRARRTTYTRSASTCWRTPSSTTAPGGRGVWRTCTGTGTRSFWRYRTRGSGIPEEDLPKVFNRFYRVDKARSRAAGGTGLGLSIVRDTVRRHGGWVTARARQPEGSVFTVGFPAVPERTGEEGDRRMKPAGRLCPAPGAAAPAAGPAAAAAREGRIPALFRLPVWEDGQALSSASPTQAETADGRALGRVDAGSAVRSHGGGAEQLPSPEGCPCGAGGWEEEGRWS